jgi:hypothetical protein
MKNAIKLSALVLLCSAQFLTVAQAQTRDDAGLQGNAGAVSGFFETSNPVNYPAGAGGWWHLLDVRHSNPNNNFAMQFAGSFFNQDLYFRKTNDNASQQWSKILMEVNGTVAFGNGSPENNERWSRVIGVTGNGSAKALISTDNIISGIWAHDNGFYGAPAGGITGTYSDHPFSIITGRVAKMTVLNNGNVGIGTTAPSEKLAIYGAVNSAPGVLALESSRNDAGYVEVGSIRAKNADGEVARIGLLRGGGSYTGEMNFMVKATNDANLKEAMRISQDGNIGIGTATPQSILNIKKTEIGTDLITIVRNTDSPNLDFVSSYSGSDDLQSGSFGFGVRPQDDAWQIWSKKPAVAWENLFSVRLNGNVGIGTINPQEKLTVAGTIGAREIKVSTNAGADFVFEPGYKLPELGELEKFVKTNKHLPEIPTAKQMVDNGVNLGELNIKLLQKVEELTLYLIEKDKKIDKLIKRVEVLESNKPKLTN